MPTAEQRRPGFRGRGPAWLLMAGLLTPPAVFGQDAPRAKLLQPRPVPDPPAAFSPPPAGPGTKPFAITLPTALELAHVRSLDVAAAGLQLRAATARLARARVQWLPTIALGADYYRHEGRLQDIRGEILDTTKSSLMVGVGSAPGAAAAVSTNEALFAPLAARQQVRAREADVRSAVNDTLLSVSVAYFDVQQARGELAGAADASRRAADLVRRTEQLAAGLVPPVEAVRAQAELALRQQAEQTARERWRVASADLLRLLDLPPGLEVEPAEPPHLTYQLIDPAVGSDDLLATALLNRPELESQQALVQAAVTALRQERCRPLMPSVLVRGASTNPAGTLATGAFGGGLDGSLGRFGSRLDLDVQVLWQLDNLGFGNRARVDERQAEASLAEVNFRRTRDRIGAEVTQALARAQSATRRAELAETELRLAIDSAEKSLAGVSQTRRAGELVVLVVRPQEAVASVQALAQAYADYYGAVTDANRAQFRLYRALGQPAQMLLDRSEPAPVVPAATIGPVR